MPAVASGESITYLPESSGLQLNWDYTETPPKRPQPKILNSANYEVKWKIDNSLMFDLIQDQDGILYTSASNDIVQATYPNGKVKWSIQLDMGFDISIIDLILGLDGTIYAYSSDDFSDKKSTTIYALSPEGSIQWKLHSTNIPSKFKHHFAGDSLGNFVYFSDEGLVSRNSKGEINWVNKDIQPIFSEYYHYPILLSNLFVDSKGNLYVDSEEKEIISLDPTGNIRWRSEPQRFLDGFSVFRPFFSNGGLLYMLIRDGLHAINTNDGSTVKITPRSDLKEILSSGIPTDGKGGYYIDIQGVLTKIDYNGKILWHYVPRETEKYGIGFLRSLATDEHGNVYFPTGVGNIIGLNSDGHEIFVFLRNAFWHKITSVIIGKNGNIFSLNHDIGFAAFGRKQIQVYLDNLPLLMSVAPIKNNGTVLVPFRSLFESLGLTVDWDPVAKTVTGSNEDLLIKMSIGSKIAYVNGQAKQLLEAPKIEKGSTFVPLRFIGEALGKKVSWDSQSSSVNIDSN